MYDVKICNGTIVDGTGNPRFVGDIGIRAGKIVAVGTAPDEAIREIDATGLIVSPGFVDVHTHYDAQFFWDRTLSPSPWYGITTVVWGNCGFALAPTKAQDRKFLLETLQHVEGIPFSASWPAMGIGEWGYETIAELLDLIEGKGCAVNVVTQIGHTALRTWVMGPEAATSRAATDDEIAEMCRIVTEALNAGAAGLSTSSTPAHFGAGGVPVASRFADEREHIALCHAIMEARHGLWQGNLGTIISPDFALEVLDQTGVTMHEIVPGSDPQILSELADLGYTAYGQMGIVSNIIYTGLHQPFMFALDQPGGVFMIPRLADLFNQFLELHTDEEKLDVYRQPDFLPRFIEASDNDAWNNAYWPAITVSVAPTRPEWENRKVVDIAAETGLKPAEVLYEVCVASDLAGRFSILSNTRDMMFRMHQDHILIGLHDAGAHLNQIAESRWPLNLMGDYVRERGLELERAVHMASYQCAKSYGILDRGLLMPGWYADIAIFDPESIIDGPIREHFDLPSGASRLMSDPIGVEYVLVNGTVIRENNKDALDPEGPLPGMLLREFTPHRRATPQPIPQDIRDRVHQIVEDRRELNSTRRGGGPAAKDPAHPDRDVIF